ncbi:MAG TPA: efflux RND transporter periplasmic adaptor subunit [Bacteroidetes bacterium]|nr:efflux RND transporter periplasmic adaptor subunit [Bacteroidota bacterium]
MKIKILLGLLAFATLLSCNTINNVEQKEEEHEEHSESGIVILNKKQQEALNIKLDTFQMRNLTTTVKTNGQLKVPPAATAEVTAIIGGNVKQIKVFQGDKVHKGQVLLILEHPDYIALQEQYAETAHKLEFLEKEYERRKELYENNVGAGRDFQKIKSEYNVEKAKYKGLRSRLKLLNISPEKVLKGEISSTITIKSPINGYVNEINVKIGKYVDAKDVLFEISDNNSIHADFIIYEKDVHLVKKGQKIHFTVSNMPDKEYVATIFAIGKEFEPKTRALHIHAKINGDVNGLIPGMYITGHLHTDGKYTRTLPNDAIVTEGTKSYIFVLDNETLESMEHDDENNNEHEASEEHDHEEESEHEIEEGRLAFKMVEIITGDKEDKYTEVKLIKPLPKDAKIVMNVAYYLLADMKKEETDHEH